MNVSIAASRLRFTGATWPPRAKAQLRKAQSTSQFYTSAQADAGMASKQSLHDEACHGEPLANGTFNAQSCPTTKLRYACATRRKAHRPQSSKQPSMCNVELRNQPWAGQAGSKSQLRLPALLHAASPHDAPNAAPAVLNAAGTIVRQCLSLSRSPAKKTCTKQLRPTKPARAQQWFNPFARAYSSSGKSLKPKTSYPTDDTSLRCPAAYQSWSKVVPIEPSTSMTTQACHVPAMCPPAPSAEQPVLWPQLGLCSGTISGLPE